MKGILLNNVRDFSSFNSSTTENNVSWESDPGSWSLGSTTTQTSLSTSDPSASGDDDPLVIGIMVFVFGFPITVTVILCLLQHRMYQFFLMKERLTLRMRRALNFILCRRSFENLSNQSTLDSTRQPINGFRSMQSYTVDHNKLSPMNTTSQNDSSTFGFRSTSFRSTSSAVSFRIEEPSTDFVVEIEQHNKRSHCSSNFRPSTVTTTIMEDSKNQQRSVTPT